MPASANPSSGEIRRASRTLVTWLQSRPEVLLCTFMSWLASPTPMMEPTMVCELDAGRPNHHVPRFHRIAAISSANTMAKPVPELTLRISSTGRSVMTAKATVPDDNRTPVRLQIPDHTTAILRRQRVGVDDRGHGIGGVVKSIHEFESQRDEQCQAQQQKRPDAGHGRVVEIFAEVNADIAEAGQQGQHKNPHACAAGVA